MFLRLVLGHALPERRCGIFREGGGQKVGIAYTE